MATLYQIRGMNIKATITEEEGQVTSYSSTPEDPTTIISEEHVQILQDKVEALLGMEVGTLTREAFIASLGLGDLRPEEEEILP